MDNIVEHVLRERYYQPGESSWEDVCRRVADFIGTNKDERDAFFDIINNRKFIPNSPCLMNAGTSIPMLFACFVLDVPDDLKGIGNTLTDAMCIQAKGGGTGFFFGNIRPKGSLVKSTNGIASGPVSFLKAYDAMTNVILQGGCVSADTRIQTERGVIKIGELLNCPPMADNPIQEVVASKDGFCSASLSMDNGIADVLHIKTKHGYNIKCTRDHQILVVMPDGTLEYKEAGDITKDDYLVIKRGRQIVTEYVRLPLPVLENRHFNTNLNLSLPVYLEEDLALLIGMYMANGSMSNDASFNICIGDKDHEVSDELIRIGNKYNMHFSTYRKPDNIDRSTNYSCRNIVFAEWWKSCGFYKNGSPESFVPELIFKSPESVICAFIRGVMSCDGHVHSDGYPVIGVTSERLIDDLQILFQSVGIFTIKRYQDKTNAKENGSYGTRTIYTLRVCDKTGLEKFRDKIGYIQTRKQSKLRSDISTHDLIVPYIGCILKKHYHPEGGRDRTSNPAYAKEIERYIRGDRNPSRNRIVQICGSLHELSNDVLHEDLLSDEFIFSKISDISSDRCYTVDIETFDHNYVANGIVVHNKRRGANMGSLSVWHKDIKEFITCKHKEGEISNFNISVLINDEFMKNPDPEIYNLIAEGMWKNGEPGLQFFDNINSNNPTPLLGPLYGSNPCSETFLYPNESCVLGSIDVSKFIGNDGTINYTGLNNAIELGVKFLDNCIEVNEYPTDKIRDATYLTRKIGLGIMGYADLLIKLGIRYGSDECIEFTHKFMKWFDEQAIAASSGLAKERGTFPAYKGSTWDHNGIPMRNAVVTLIAPTGSISLFAGCSSGIEPNFAYVVNRSTWTSGEKVTFKQVHTLFDAHIRQHYKDKYDEIINWMFEHGTVQNCPLVDAYTKNIFVSAKDVSWKEHVDVLAAFQKHIHNSISKTVNLPHDTTVDEMKEIIRYAWESGCKGLTVYREGSRTDVVLETNASKKENELVKVVEITNPVKYKLVKSNGRILPKTPRDSPAAMYKRTSGCGHMMIAIGEMDNKPHSVTIVNKGGCDALTQALAELTALALRWGIPLWDIRKVLTGVKCSAALKNPKSDGKSCPDILGKILYEYPCDDAPPKDDVIPEKPAVSTNTSQTKITCPDCGGILNFSEGCKSCPSCGYSKCF